MWSISVEPTPSRITRPCFSCHRYQTSAGSGSAAEMHNLTDEKSPSCSSASIALYSVGTEEDGRRAGPVRKGEVVAEAVRMEELRRRERDVLVGDAEDVPCIRLARVEEVPVQVDDALGTTGGARAVEPERHVVAERVDGQELLRRLELVDEQQLRCAHLLRAQRIDDREPGAAVPDEVGVVVGPVQRVDRYGHGSDPHRPEERSGKPWVVVHHEEHTLAALDAEIAERGACTTRPGKHLAVRQGLVPAEDRGLFPAPRFEVAIEQETCVIALGDRDRSHAHVSRLTGQSGWHKWRLGRRRDRPARLARTRLRSIRGAVLAGLPPGHRDDLARHRERARLEVGSHSVVPAVEKTKERDDGHDLDDLAVVEKASELLEVLLGREIGDERSVMGESEGRTLCVAEEIARLIAPYVRELGGLRTHASRVRGRVCLAVTASGCRAGDERNKLLQLPGHGSRACRLHQRRHRTQDLGATRHREQAVGKEAHALLDGAEGPLELRDVLAWEWWYPCHLSPPSSPQHSRSCHSRSSSPSCVP